MLNRDEWRGNHAVEEWCLSIGMHVASGLSAKPRHIPTIRHLIIIYTHLRRSNTYMGLRKFSSGLKKNLKRRLTGIGCGLEGIEADVGEGGVGSTSSLPQPGPRAVAQGKRNRPKSWNEGYVDGRQADPTPNLDNPRVACSSKSQHDRGGREAVVKGREVSESGSDIERVVEDAPGRGGENVDHVDPSPSTPSISRDGDPEGTQITQYFTHCL